MATIIERYNPFSRKDDVINTFEGLFIDFLLERFPAGFPRPTSVALNNEELPVGDFDVLLQKDDVIEITIAVQDPVSLGISLVIAAVSAVLTYNAVRGALNGANPAGSLALEEELPSTTYSIRAQGNYAKLGEIIPVLYGKYRFFPDMAAVPWQEYVNNEQVSYQLLSLGMGRVDFHELFFGDVSFSDSVKSIVGAAGPIASYEYVPPGQPVTLFHTRNVPLDIAKSVPIEHPTGGLEILSETHMYYVNHSSYQGAWVDQQYFLYDIVKATSGDFYMCVPASTATAGGGWSDPEGANNGEWLALGFDYEQDIIDYFSEAHIIFVRGGAESALDIRTVLQVYDRPLWIPEDFDIYDPSNFYAETIKYNEASCSAFLLPWVTGAVNEFVFRSNIPDFDAGTRVLQSGMAIEFTLPTSAPGKILIASRGAFPAGVSLGSAKQQSLLYVTELGSGATARLGAAIPYSPVYRPTGGTAFDATSAVSFDFSESTPETNTDYNIALIPDVTPADILRGYASSGTTMYTTAITGDGITTRRTLRPATGVSQVNFYVAQCDTNVATLDSVKVRYDNQEYFGPVSLLAVRLVASEFLSSTASRKISVTATRKLPVWNGTSWDAPAATRNPAWAIADVWMAAYGASQNYLTLDLPTFTALADTWEDRGDTFDGIIDTEMGLWETISMIAAVGRARPLVINGTLTLVRDEAKTTRTALFTDRNIIKNSLTIDYTFATQGEPDGVQVEYYDEDDSYLKTLVLSDESSNNPLKVSGVGRTQYAHAWRDSQYLDARRRLLRETINFDVELDGFLPLPGDFVGVVHEMPEWGQAGQLVAATYSAPNTVIEVRADLIWTGTFTAEVPDTTHYILLRNLNGDVFGPYSVTKDPDDIDNARKLKILSFNPSSGGFEIVTSLSSIERTIFTFGVANSYVKDCVIQEIQPKSDTTCTIIAEVYVAAVHTADVGTPPAKPEFPLDTDPVPGPIAGLTLSNVAGSGDVVATWNPAYDVDSYDVEKSTDGTTFAPEATPTSPLHTVTSVSDGAFWVRVAGVYGSETGPYTTQKLNVT